MISIKNGSDPIPTTKSTLFIVNKDKWDTKEVPGQSMKNVLYVQQYGKRHLSGLSDIEQQKNQARSLSHCQVTQVWRNKSFSQAVS